jgi:hypothetical protein
MKPLSKSKLMNYRQCAKRLWLEVHEPELRMDSESAQAAFATGFQVGELARQLYDPKERGVMMDPFKEGWEKTFDRTKDELARHLRPVFEAGFQTRDQSALCMADVLLPVAGGWRMIEVKSSTYKENGQGRPDIKAVLHDDVAVQAYVSRSAGLALERVTLALINSGWVYPGDGDYRGLFKEVDLTGEVRDRADEVRGWIREAQAIVALPREPDLRTGGHCHDPYECGYLPYCQAQEPQTEYPVAWLPRPTTKLKDFAEVHRARHGVTDMRDVPDGLLNETQRRVKQVTLTGQPFFDRQGAARAVAKTLPAYFLDFESIQFAVPRWKGMRPYQQTVFQFSVHRLSRTGELAQTSFLDLSGADPSSACAQALLAACGERGPIYVYNQAFEKTRIGELAERFPAMKRGLLALNERIVDLLPVAREHYYHPSQQGSWSIKAVLPAMFPDLSYDELDGVQDGGGAQAAYLEAIHPDTTPQRQEEIRRQLLDYCALDTYATVKLWAAFTGTSLKD